MCPGYGSPLAEHNDPRRLQLRFKRLDLLSPPQIDFGFELRDARVELFQPGCPLPKVPLS
jgi:hypothetical protein